MLLALYSRGCWRRHSRQLVFSFNCSPSCSLPPPLVCSHSILVDARHIPCPGQWVVRVSYLVHLHSAYSPPLPSLLALGLLYPFPSARFPPPCLILSFLFLLVHPLPYPDESCHMVSNFVCLIICIFLHVSNLSFFRAE